MKLIFHVIAFLLLFFPTAICSQVTVARKSTSLPKSPQDEKYLAVLAEVKDRFESGITELEMRRQSLARVKFDRSVEAFLYSTITADVENEQVHKCYLSLIDVIYQLDTSSVDSSKLLELYKTCGWKTNKLIVSSRLWTLRPSTVAAAPNDSTVDASEETVDASSESSIFYVPVGSGVAWRIVRARADDTVAKIAAREKVNPADLAKFNGLLPNSVLFSGREIRIPTDNSSIGPRYAKPQWIPPLPKPVWDISPGPTQARETSPGPKPVQRKNGSVRAVVAYLNEVLDDPYSMRIAKWGNLYLSRALGLPVWAVRVKFRAKNRFGAYALSERIFYIRDEKVLSSEILY
ncbi:MAG: LysM peptidoglycan-binding domain-containing protein [Acidobacteria bacterium]|nr:LysM peptidoglycan-binding domain-containing protein [Acidobacteriota bacterium]